MKAAQPVILQILPELRTGGVERGTVEITEAIAKAGWKAIIASAGGEMMPQVVYAGGEHITLPLTSKNPLKIWQNAAAIEKIIRERNVDIVHARSRAPAWSAYLAAKRTNTTFLTTFHGIYGIQNGLKKAYNSVMIKGKRIIAVSHFVAQHIKQEYEVNDAVIRVVQRGADTQLFSLDKVTPAKIEELSKAWRLPDSDAPIILVPGRITRWKGQDVCVRALGKLPHRRFHCLLVGDDAKHPDFSHELRQLIRELDLEGHVFMVGNTKFMTEAYAMSSLVVCPSIEPEAFGRIPVEAQSCGRPVIATRHGGACETVQDGVTGWLVAPNHVGELAAAIETALTLPLAQKEAMAQNARWNIEQHFSTRAMQEKTLEVYKELLA
jgi:glycosyltransferase involved in cell wall biosynthesis